MKVIKVSKIIEYLGVGIRTIFGFESDFYVRGISGKHNSDPEKIDWIHTKNTNAQSIAEISNAKLIICADNVKYSNLIKKQKKILLIVNDPYQAIALVGNKFFVKKRKYEIHSTAVVSKDAVLGENIAIGAYAIVEACLIGDNCVINEHAIIRENVVVGNNVNIGAGVRLGEPGFSFFNDANNELVRFPQIGKLIIGDRVEIGANTCIDRGAFSDTIVDRDVKINNLCHIAHNVVLGQRTVIAANVNVSGSTIIGRDVWIGPNACFRGHLRIGDGCLIGAGANVVSDVPAKEVWVGNPARFLRKNE